MQKQVSEGKVRVDGSNDVLTMALGPEHPGRVRGVGAGVSPRQYFNLPKPQRVSFDDRLKDSLRVLLQEETKKMEAKAREEALRMEARTKQLVEAEREHFLSQLSQLIPNFDPSMLKPRISQSPKNPMSDKASCSGGDVRSLHLEDDTAKMGKHQPDEEKEEEKRDEEKEKEKEKEDEEKHDDKVCSHNFAFFICFSKFQTSIFLFNPSFVYNLDGGIFLRRNKIFKRRFFHRRLNGFRRRFFHKTVVFIKLPRPFFHRRVNTFQTTFFSLNRRLY